mmetsp:Transcript_18889/g.52759  ORF Transcript_18889/g.52759 Transcript_18889/m.52759 type:complete len:100 (-) Transcript_18889:1319-1618(-)
MGERDIIIREHNKTVWPSDTNGKQKINTSRPNEAKTVSNFEFDRLNDSTKPNVTFRNKRQRFSLKLKICENSTYTLNLKRCQMTESSFFAIAIDELHFV